MSVLSQPYPIRRDPRFNFRIAVGIGLFVFLFLYGFRPFGLHIFSEARLLTLTAGYGLVTLLITLFCLLLIPKMVPRFFDDEKWVVGKHLGYSAFVVTSISLGNWLFGVVAGLYDASLSSFLFTITSTFLVGVLPVVFVTLYIYSILLKRHLNEARMMMQGLEHRKQEALNKSLAALQPAQETQPSPPASTSVNGNVVLWDENEKDKLEIDPKALLFLESVDNYVEVYYKLNGKAEKTLLRSSLKRYEDLLQPYPQFFRSHRTYLVNLNKVKDISGNSAGYRLVLEDVSKEIPVARSHSKAFRDLMGS